VVSRKDIDVDALSVLYRLKNNGFTAYLVGGGVRDLLLARKPKDFDISTSAHPQQVKKLFRNCFIIGRRFRLCHVRFGAKVIEVSTFRKLAEPTEGDTLIRRDNTFGTPEEDAFRRDFTVNALFYDIATFSVIDFVRGLDDLKARVIRTIGDPAVRFREDPVRMLRAVALAARLGFTIDRDSVEAIRALRGEITKSSPARLVEEFYKILRQGAARRTFEMLREIGLLTYLVPEAETEISSGAGRLLSSLERLDQYRNAGPVSPKGLSNALLSGTLLVPLGLERRRAAPQRQRERKPTADEVAEAAVAAATAGPQEPADDVAAEMAALGAEEEPTPSEPIALNLPFARKDLDRIRLVLAAQRRLREAGAPLHAKRALALRPYFEDALTWLEIHGGAEGLELAAHWRSLDVGDVRAPGQPAESGGAERPPGSGRRRRRRRRHFRGAPKQPA
jgi:poly(A) polymerase